VKAVNVLASRSPTKAQAQALSKMYDDTSVQIVHEELTKGAFFELGLPKEGTISKVVCRLVRLALYPEALQLCAAAVGGDDWKEQKPIPDYTKVLESLHSSEETKEMPEDEEKGLAYANAYDWGNTADSTGAAMMDASSGQEVPQHVDEEDDFSFGDDEDDEDDEEEDEEMEAEEEDNAAGESAPEEGTKQDPVDVERVSLRQYCLNAYQMSRARPLDPERRKAQRFSDHRTKPPSIHRVERPEWATITDQQKLDVDTVVKDIVPNNLVEFVEADIDPKVFWKDYVQQHKPVVFKAGSIEHWPSIKKWANITLLMQLYSNISVRLSELPTPDGSVQNAEKSSFGHVFDEVELGKFHRDVFVQKNVYPDVRTIFMTNEDTHPMAADHERPKCFDEILNEAWSESTHRVTKNNRSRDAWEFLMGPVLSGAHVHHHPAAFNALIAGTKAWFMWPPHLPPYSISDPKAAPRTGYTPPYAWVHDDLDELRNTKWAPIEFIQHAGEVVYIPDFWHHIVINIEPVIGTSAQLGHAVNPTETEADYEVLRKQFLQPVNLEQMWPAGVRSDMLPNWEPGMLSAYSKNAGLAK
jgi:hypothetical protein